MVQVLSFIMLTKLNNNKGNRVKIASTMQWGNYRSQRSWGKAVFSQACVILFTGGCVCLLGGAWLPGGVCGCWGGMCGCRGHVWLPGIEGMHGCLGEHAWLLGGVCGCEGHAWLPGGDMHGCWGCVWLLGACMVAGGVCVARGHAWQKGVHAWQGGCAWQRGACVVKGGMRGIRRDTEIRSMSGRYASYWNAFLFKLRNG